MRMSDWSSDVCSSDLADFAALGLFRAGGQQLFLLGGDYGRLTENGVAIALILDERRQAHAVTDLQVAWFRKCAHHLVWEFGELQQIVKILLGDRQALGHLRPDALIIGFHRVPIISGPLEIGYVLALPGFRSEERLVGKE